MRAPRALLVLFFCLTFPAATLRAQTQPAATPSSPSPSPAPALAPAAENPQTPAEFFARARQLSDLEAAGIPFHLKATCVASGDADYKGNGTYEEWWKDKENWRKEATLGDFRLALVNSPEGPHFYANSGDIPELLMDAMSAALIHFGPDAGTAGDWRIKQKKIAGVKLTKLSVKSRPSPHGGMIAAQVYYFTSDGTLRIQQLSVRKTLYNDVRPFQTLLIPRTIVTKSGQKRLLKLSIETLEPLKTDNETTPKIASIPNDLPLIGDYMVGVPSTVAGNLIYQPQPTYPAEAKQRRIQGRVIMVAIVDENGNIRYLHVIKSPNVLLSNASLDAVRRWLYQPTIMDGKSVAVYTTITIAFTLNE